jgi:hypothetical protein
MALDVMSEMESFGLQVEDEDDDGDEEDTDEFDEESMVALVRFESLLLAVPMLPVPLPFVFVLEFE